MPKSNSKTTPDKNPVHPVNPVKTGHLVSALLDWFSKNARDLPWRHTSDPYAIHVSEIMLQQTQVKTVIPFWERWMRELPTIEALAGATSPKTHKLWEGLGYYTRVRNLQKAAQLIMAEHDGKFPTTFDAVLALPGVGRYTAGAICSIAFNQPTPLLDGNVIRVLTRIYGIGENPKDKTVNAHLWSLAEDLVRAAAKTKQPHACSHLNQSLMELGALICTPRSPQCLICPVQKFCIAYRESRTEELPKLGKRETATTRFFTAFVVRHDDKYLVRQRPAGIVNAHLWEFPNIETGVPITESKLLAAEFATLKIGKPAGDFNRLCTIKHSITRYRITLSAFVVSVSKPAKHSAGQWLTLPEMQTLAFTSAHRKILKILCH